MRTPLKWSWPTKSVSSPSTCRVACTKGNPQRCSDRMIFSGVLAVGTRMMPSTACSRMRMRIRSWRSADSPEIAEDRQPPTAFQSGVNAGGELRIERVGDVADDQTNGVGLTRAQIGCSAVVNVTEILDRGFHAFARFILDQRALAQHQRDGSARNADGGRYLEKRNLPIARIFTLRIFLCHGRSPFMKDQSVGCRSVGCQPEGSGITMCPAVRMAPSTTGCQLRKPARPGGRFPMRGARSVAALKIRVDPGSRR